MDRNRFNAEVRGSLTEIPIGIQGVAFDRLELDAWASNISPATGVPVERKELRYGTQKDARPRLRDTGLGESTNTSAGGEFAKALERLGSKKRNATSPVFQGEQKRANLRSKATRTFEQAAAKYVLENDTSEALSDDVGRLKSFMPAIGSAPLDRLHTGTLQPWSRIAGRTASLGNHQPWTEGSAAHPESGCAGVDRRARARPGFTRPRRSACCRTRRSGSPTR